MCRTSCRFKIILLYFATPLWIATISLIVLLKRRAVFEPPFSLMLTASIGFLLAFYVQRKGFAYHSYPMLALALMALALAFIEQWQQELAAASTGIMKRVARAFSASLIVGLTLCWMSFAFDPTALAAAIRPITPHPKIMALSSYLWTGFPLTRDLQGSWVGRASSLWITGGVWHRRQTEDLDRQTDRRLQAYFDRDRVMFTEDVARNRPDVIVVNNRKHDPWTAWIETYPPLAAQMAHYRKYRSVDGFDILRRDPDP